MKKFLLLTLVALFAFNYQANAQIGVKLGYNFAKQTNETETLSDLKAAGIDLEYNKKTLNSMSFGIFYDKDIIPLLDIRLGLEFSPKGTKTKNDKFDAEIKNKINYLEVPVLAKVKVGPVYALGGFYGAYAMNGKIDSKFKKIDDLIEKMGGIGEVIGEKVKSKLKENKDMNFDDKGTKRMDYGVKFGAGFQMGLGPVHAFAQVEYSYGLANISNIEGINTHNSVLALTVGVILGM